MSATFASGRSGVRHLLGHTPPVAAFGPFLALAAA
jgi:hypothetical protein